MLSRLTVHRLSAAAQAVAPKSTASAIFSATQRSTPRNAARRRSASGADRVLINAGTLSEEIYLRELDARAGIPFEPLEDVPRDACSLADERLLEAATHGILPLRQGEKHRSSLHRAGLAVRRILQMHPASGNAFASRQPSG